jgi:hypothetical protein
MFAELQSHYLFDDRFGDRAKATTKARLRGWGRGTLSRYLPAPVAANYEWRATV